MAGLSAKRAAPVAAAVLAIALSALACSRGDGGTPPPGRDERNYGLVDTGRAVAAAQEEIAPPPPAQPRTALERHDLSTYAPGAADFLASREPQWGAAFVLPATGVAYELNALQQFPLSSLTKVLILAAFLDGVAAEGRDLTAAEDSLLRDMITVSDNEAAAVAWGGIGGSGGLTEFLHAHGLNGIMPALSGLSWGDTTASARALGDFMLRLWNGDLLAVGYRAYALELMASVADEQRWGSTAAFAESDAPVAVKNGWYPAVTGWRVASLAMEMDGDAPAILVVLTRNQPDMEYGIETIEGVAARIAEARAGAAPAPAAVTVHSGETVQALFQPSAEGLPPVAGDCVASNTIRRARSWSCVVDGSLFQHCFSSPATPTLAVCDATPAAAGTFAVPLDESLVASVARPERGSPWLLLLEDGTYCAATRSGAVNEDGDRVTYECADGTMLLGPIQRTATFYALRAGPTEPWLATVRVRAAWF